MRHLTQFSLRSLFLLVTVLCVFVGYEMNWIHRRRQFNAVQRKIVASDDYLASQVNNVAHATRNMYLSPATSGVNVRPPNCLGWFGEQGFDAIIVIVPLHDATRLAPKDCITEPYPEPNTGFRPYYIWSTQKDYCTAKRLFPEARLYVAYVDSGTPFGFVGVFVRDKESGLYRVDERLIEEERLN